MHAMRSPILTFSYRKWASTGPLVRLTYASLLDDNGAVIRCRQNQNWMDLRSVDCEQWHISILSHWAEKVGLQDAGCSETLQVLQLML